MFHGGTNFGLTSGANDKGVYRPTITSYDYDAPLDEAGNPTAKFHAFREVIARYAPVPDVVPASGPRAPETSAALGSPVRLLSAPSRWGAWSEHPEMPTLDELDTRLALFRTEVSTDGPALLTVGEVRDRAHVFLDGAPIGVLDRERHDRALMLPHGGRLAIVVEDQGRVNYGQRIGEPKGLIGPIRLGADELTDWSACAIDLDSVPHLWSQPDGAQPTEAPGVGPTAWRGSFDVGAPVDHFLSTVAWGKGIAWVNGFCLGRYWRRGPQETLYVPGPVLRSGPNELVVLELDVMVDPVAHFVAGPSLGPLEL